MRLQYKMQDLPGVDFFFWREKNRNPNVPLGGGFKSTQTCFFFHPYPWGFMIQIDEHIFQNGLVQPPTSWSRDGLFTCLPTFGNKWPHSKGKWLGKYSYPMEHVGKEFAQKNQSGFQLVHVITHHTIHGTGIIGIFTHIWLGFDGK